MELERRMPRFEKIPIRTAPENIKDWYKKQKYSNDEITVFKLRNIWFISPKIEIEISKQAMKYINNMDRINNYKNNCATIKTINDFELLIDFLDKDEYQDLRIELVERILDLREKVYLNIIDRLKTRYSESFFDNALRIFIRTMKKRDITDELIGLLRSNLVRDPQDFSSILQLIGLMKKESNLDYLYTFYNFLIDNFEEKNYFEGPLFGIGYFLEENG